MSSRSCEVGLRTCLALVLGGIIAACSEVPQGAYEDPIESIIAAPVDETELATGFERKSTMDIVYVLNEVKKSPPDFRVINLVHCAYTSCDRSGSWNQAALRQAIVRINLIDTLIQAAHRGIEVPSLDELEGEAGRYINHEDPAVVQRALMVLSYLDRPSDVATIENVAMRTESKLTFRVAIIALRFMRNEEAAHALTRIRSNAPSDYIADVQDLLIE